MGALTNINKGEGDSTEVALSFRNNRMHEIRNSKQIRITQTQNSNGRVS
jgi:hypothetical protein